MNVQSFILLSYYNFLLRYRRTVLGPAWLLISPGIFIVMLGILYAGISSVSVDVFIPHLAVGLVTWSLINSFIVGAATIFQRNRSQILQGVQTIDNIIIIEATATILSFIHQLPIILIVLFVYKIGAEWVIFLSILGLFVLMVNGIWVCYVFGILGVRFRDLGEAFNAIMRITFLATPIIWIPTENISGGVMGSFLIYNPFYHYVEIIRAPLLGQPPSVLSWAVVIGISIVGVLAAWFLRKRRGHLVPYWL